MKISLTLIAGATVLMLPLSLSAATYSYNASSPDLHLMKRIVIHIGLTP